jgi:hypothetical protein
MDLWPPLHRNIDIEQYDIDATHPSNMLLPPPMPRDRNRELVLIGVLVGLVLQTVLDVVVYWLVG